VPKEIESFNHLICKGLLKTWNLTEEEKVPFLASPSLISRALSADRQARGIGFRLWTKYIPHRRTMAPICQIKIGNATIYVEGN